MNYLAHAHLSFGNPHWLVGNLISDWVKGKNQINYPYEIQQGIALHRAIDEFTDNHSITKQTKGVFRSSYRLYAGAFLDVSYDYFLANHLTYFPTILALEKFAEQVYSSVREQYNVLPPTFHSFLDNMSSQNWLYKYHTKSGIKNSFAGLVKRSLYLTEWQTAYKIFEDNYYTLEKSFQEFYPQLLDFSTNYTEKWTSTKAVFSIKSFDRSCFSSHNRKTTETDLL